MDIDGGIYGNLIRFSNRSCSFLSASACSLFFFSVHFSQAQIRNVSTANCLTSSPLSDRNVLTVSHSWYSRRFSRGNLCFLQILLSYPRFLQPTDLLWSPWVCLPELLLGTGKPSAGALADSLVYSMKRNRDTFYCSKRQLYNTFRF